MCLPPDVMQLPRHVWRGEMRQYNVGAPFESIAGHVAGPFSETPSGLRCLLVVTDYLVKWPEVYPMKIEDAVTVADQLVHNWVGRLRVPLELRSDRVRSSEFDIFQDVFELLMMRKIWRLNWTKVWWNGRTLRAEDSSSSFAEGSIIKPTRLGRKGITIPTSMQVPLGGVQRKWCTEENFALPTIC